MGLDRIMYEAHNTLFPVMPTVRRRTWRQLVNAKNQQCTFHASGMLQHWGINREELMVVFCQLQVVRTLVSPANATQVVSPAQKAVAACGLLSELCALLMTPGVPAEILSEIICTVGESIRGCRSNQEFFGQVMASSSPPRTALVVLLMSMVNEKQPVPLRTAVLYCFECFLYKNDVSQGQIIQALLPTSAEGELESLDQSLVMC